MSAAVTSSGPRRYLAGLSRLLVRLLQQPILFYRKYISPTLPPLCRYHPSCSQYALEALERRGPLVGLVLVGWRLCRCTPLGRGGHDPVPERRRSEGVSP
jgi:putative membrane protein insertion efficiency factor